MLLVVGLPLAVVMVILAAVLLPGRGGQEAGPGATAAQGRSVGSAALANSGATSGDVIAKAQARLKLLPKDSATWASLGLAYVQKGRESVDPSYYPKAQQALDRSMSLMPSGNVPGLAGQAVLAAARHDFSAARDLAQQAADLDPYNSTVQGVLGDAENELGDYDAAFATFQRMNDLDPGVPAYTRASYAWQLRGDSAKAVSAMQMALDAAYSPADKSFSAFYLGELAFYDGDLTGALTRYQQALDVDPSSAAALDGRAKAYAALGRTDEAVADYAKVVQEVPQSLYLIEYGDLLTSLGRTDEAKQQYDLVRTEQQLFAAQGVDTDLELALFDADHGDPAAALKSAQQEFAKRQSILVEDALAWALHVNGRDAEAAPHAASAVRLGYHDSLLYYHQGMIANSLGDTATARSALTRALQLNPHFNPIQAPQARAALAALGS